MLPISSRNAGVVVEGGAADNEKLCWRTADVPKAESVTTWDLRLGIAAAKDVLVQFHVVGVPLVSLPLLRAGDWQRGGIGETQR
jgi:hypothetical protein